MDAQDKLVAGVAGIALIGGALLTSAVVVATGTTTRVVVTTPTPSAKPSLLKYNERGQLVFEDGSPLLSDGTTPHDLETPGVLPTPSPGCTVTYEHPICVGG
jgi:hypothetical protein